MKKSFWRVHQRHSSANACVSTYARGNGRVVLLTVVDVGGLFVAAGAEDAAEGVHAGGDELLAVGRVCEKRRAVHVCDGVS
jgi:hypothetical protein